MAVANVDRWQGVKGSHDVPAYGFDFILPVFVACATMQESFYWQFGIRQRFLDGWTVFLGTACLLAFALGSFLTAACGSKPPGPRPKSDISTPKRSAAACSCSTG